jgi:alcohol dehydrogenase (cytochrome c)
MTLKRLVLTTTIAAMPVMLAGQQLDWGAQTPKPVPGPAASNGPATGGLDPATLNKPLADTWPTYSGDYTGRRYSALNQINQQNVKGLTLAWTARVTAGSATPGGGGFGGFGGRGGGGGGAPTIVGGEGAGDFPTGGANVKGAVLYHDGVLYVTAPDNTWALDARDGRLLWQYFWKTKGGTHIGSRGAALWHDYLFFETPDNYLVSLDTKTGKERWHVEISDFNQQYFSTMAPMVIADQVLVGTGNDLDAPGFLQSYDPVTGNRKWIFYTVPMKPGDPGLDTWPSLESARHGGGQVWIPGVYDPDTKLYIFGTGNPTPGYTGVGRKGDNLFTCSLVAVNVETGKMAWYYQTSPHDTHDWDSAQTPVLIDTTINGKPRKLVSTASRNGYFFTVDRTNGEPVASEPYGVASNWIKGETPKGNPVPDPGKEATIPGSLVSPVEGGVTNWPPPAYSPDTGLFYVNENNGFNILYLTDPDPRGSMGLGGKAVAPVGSAGSFLTAIDPKTGKVAWRYPYPGVSGAGGSGGLLTTAGGLLFGGDAAGNFVARDAKTGKPLWHSRIGSPSNAPQTYSVDGKQQVLVAVGDTLYVFALY